MALFDDAFDTFDYESSDIIALPSTDYKYSPAVPTMYSPSMAMSRTTSASSHMGTVSPQELELTFSAPSSTAFTNLTSPSGFNESPHLFDDSPMIEGDGLHGQDSWFPLFNEGINETIEANPIEAQFQQPVEASPLLALEQLDGPEILNVEEQITVGEQLRASSERRRSSTSPSATTKASSSAGVSARRRNQPLPPIIVEDKNDVVAMKRARNTLAARKSRQKKMEKFEELEAELAKMRDERDYWKSMALQRNPAQ